MKYSYDTTQNKIDFLTALLARLKRNQAKCWPAPWLCVIARLDLADDELGNGHTLPQYGKFIQDQLIDDGKLTMDEVKDGRAGFGHGDGDHDVPRSILFSTRIQYLEDKIKFFQDQLKKESKPVYSEDMKTSEFLEHIRQRFITLNWLESNFLCHEAIRTFEEAGPWMSLHEQPEAQRMQKILKSEGIKTAGNGFNGDYIRWDNADCFLRNFRRYATLCALIQKYKNIENPSKTETIQPQKEKESKIQLKKKKKHIPIGKQYQKTIDTSGWSNEQFNSLHRGQWVNNFGATGQFLGITARGTVTVNYKQTKDARKQYAANKPLRQFVKLHGGK